MEEIITYPRGDQEFHGPSRYFGFIVFDHLVGMKTNAIAVCLLGIMLSGAAQCEEIGTDKGDGSNNLRRELELRSYKNSPEDVVMKKGRGAVIKATAKHIEIDKGSLNVVHERDVYEVLDSSGLVKCLAEMRGMGDLHAIGRIYGKKHGVNVETGDAVRFVGQRKFVEMGLMYGQSLLADSSRIYRGVGLMWKWNYTGGWATEFLWSYYAINESSSKGKLNRLGDQKTELEKDVDILLPFGIRKQMYYPGNVSPYVGLGMAYFRGIIRSRVIEVRGISGYGGAQIHYRYPEEKAKKRGFVPYGQIGIEFFPGKQMHFGCEIRKFVVPRLQNGTINEKDDADIGNLYFTTSW